MSDSTKLPSVDQTPVPDVPSVPAVPPVDAGGASERAGSEDDLLDSISRNFGSGSDAIADAKKDSLAEMSKSLPEWSLEPPETFLK